MSTAAARQEARQLLKRSGPPNIAFCEGAPATLATTAALPRDAAGAKGIIDKWTRGRTLRTIREAL